MDKNVCQQGQVGGCMVRTTGLDPNDQSSNPGEKRAHGRHILNKVAMC